MSQTATVTVQLTASPDAAKAAAALAAELKKAADAEEAYQKKLAKTVELLKEKARLTADMVKAGVIADRKLTPEQAGRQMIDRADDRRKARQEALKLDPDSRRRSEMSEADRRNDNVRRMSDRAYDRQDMVRRFPELKRAGEMSVDEKVAKERQRQTDKKDLNDRLVAEGLRAGPKVNAPPKSVHELAAARVAAAKKEQAVQAAAHHMGGGRVQSGVDLMTAVNDGGITGGALALGKQLAGRSAFGLAAVGTVAAAGYAAHHMAGNYIDQQKREGDAYMTARQRDELNVRNSGFGLGSIRGMALDFGRSQAGGFAKVGAANRRNSEAEIRGGFEERIGSMQSSGEVEIRMARLREAEFKGMNDSSRDPRNLDRSTPGGRQVYENLHGPRRDQGIDRSTALGKKLFEEEARLLPARKELFFATKERTAAERNVEKATADEFHTKKRLEAAESEFAKHKERFFAKEKGTRYSDNEVAGDLANLGADFNEAGRVRDRALSRHLDAGQITKDAKLGLRQRKGEESQAIAGVAAANYETMKQREQTAAGQAQRLGSMGAVDLATGLNAIQALNTHGYESFSQEQKASLRGIAPDRAREEEEKLGMKLAPTLEKMLPGGEFRPGGLAAAKKAADAAGVGEENAGYTAKEVSTQGFADALQEGLDKFTAVLRLQMAAAVGRVERQMFDANNAKN